MNNNDNVTTDPDLTESNSEVTTQPTTIPDAQELTNENTSQNEQAVINQNGSQKVFYGSENDNSNTATRFEALPEIDFKYTDNVNLNAFSKNMISHSYGVADDEKPHTISIENQKFFDDNNFDAICYDSKTDEKVLYLTFDCGYENGYTAQILDTLQEKNVPAAFFCTLPQMKDNHDIIARMINEGHIVGNHSVTHPDFSSLSAEQIITEIKGFDDYIRENFGYSSFYFRYPQGKYSEYSLSAVNDLGFKCVFWSLAYADWDINAQKGAEYAKNTVMARIHPGAVILLHAVSPDNANALSDIIDLCRAKGYEFRSLEEID